MAVCDDREAWQGVIHQEYFLRLWRLDYEQNQTCMISNYNMHGNCVWLLKAATPTDGRTSPATSGAIH